MADYIRILVVKIKRIFTDELKIYRSRDDLSDEGVDEIIKTGKDANSLIIELGLVGEVNKKDII